MDVSVIIPVYNAEKYLKECIYSVLKQEKVLFEIICVDDASQDDSAEIIRDISSKDNRFVFLRNDENHGQAYARNRGIENARGKYLYFLDSDDELLDSMALYRLMERAEEDGSDCVCFDSIIEYESEEMKPLLANRRILREVFEPKVYSGAEYFELFFSDPGFSVAVWRQFWKKQFILDSCIRFYENTSPHEDLLFTFQAFYLSHQITYISESLHKYRFRSNSSSSGKVDLRRLKTYQNIYIESLRFIEKHPAVGRKISEKCLSQYLRSCISPIYINYAQIIMENEEMFKNKQQYIEDSDDFFRNWIIMQRFPLLERVFYPKEVYELKKADTIIVYGAGNYSIQLQQMLLDFGIGDYHVCVTKSKGKEMEISEMGQYADRAVVILAVSSLYQAEMKNTALSLGFKNFIELGNE